MARRLAIEGYFVDLAGIAHLVSICYRLFSIDRVLVRPVEIPVALHSELICLFVQDSGYRW